MKLSLQSQSQCVFRGDRDLSLASLFEKRLFQRSSFLSGQISSQRPLQGLCDFCPVPALALVATHAKRPLRAPSGRLEVHRRSIGRQQDASHSLLAKTTLDGSFPKNALKQYNEYLLQSYARRRGFG
jgi:hypothetical protein